MRTIKFRGKHGKEWVYGNLVCLTDTEKYVINEKEVCVDTIGQYTGFKDVNGNDIYEGDILKNAFSDKPFGVVEWSIYGGYYYINCSVRSYNGYNSYRPLGEMLDVKIDGKPVNLEVIGNVYDNPELFKKEK